MKRQKKTFFNSYFQFFFINGFHIPFIVRPYRSLQKNTFKYNEKVYFLFKLFYKPLDYRSNVLFFKRNQKNFL